MSSDQQQMLAVLAEIRGSHREIIELLSHRQRLAAEPIQDSRATMAESVYLQKNRPATATHHHADRSTGYSGMYLAIAYLVIRYF